MDPRHAPSYTMADAARYLRLPVGTLRSWVKGRSYPRAVDEGFFPPLLTLPDDSGYLSFVNLIEAHVLRALRVNHNVRIADVRTAIKCAEKQLGINHLLISPELRASGGKLFLDTYSELICLSLSGQMAIRQTFDEHLDRIDWDPLRLFPFLGDSVSDRTVVIDPRLAFGRPVTAKRKISTHVIVDRLNAGETAEYLAEDYDIDVSDIKAAVLCERRQAA